MRRLLVVLAVLGFAATAFADDDDDEAAPTPPPAAAHRSPAKTADKKPDEKKADEKKPANEAVPGTDTAEHCQPPDSLNRDQANAYAAACSFFTGVAERDPVRVSRSCRAPFYFEGRPVNSAEDVARRWTALLGELQDTRANFYGFELLSYDDMVKKYGKPPAKLDNVPLRGAMIAVGNLDGYANVIALKHEGGVWSVFAFHD